MFTIPAFDYVASPLMVLFFGILLLIQWRYPLRKQHYASLRRIIRNIGVALPTFVILRLALLPLPLLVAVWAKDNNVGLINWLLPEQGVWAWVGYALGFLVFDYAYYWWHYATHQISFLYRFHQVHHSDLDMDTSTAIRFHFVELLMSIAFRVLIVLAFGIGFWVAIVYEVVFETAAQFHHSNWKLPKWVEATINVLFVTPRMHGIHHSIVRDEFNSNWGTVFSLWDRLHGTHRMDIAQRELTMGVPAYRDDDELTVSKLLAMPFQKQRDWKLPNGDRPETRTRTETSADSNVAD